MQHTAAGIDQREHMSPALVVGRLHLLEQVLVTARLDAEDETRVSVLQIGDVRRVGTQGILDENHRQMRMFAAKMLESAAGGVLFAIVLGAAVLFDDRFGAQGDDFLMIGMDDNQAQHLMVVGDLAVTAGFDQTLGAVNVFGRIIVCAVAGEQVMSLVEDKGFEGLAALQLPKDAGEARPKLLWVDFVEDGAHLGIAGDCLHAEYGSQVDRIVLTLLIEGQERRGFEGKEGKPRHQSVGERNFGLGAGIINFLEFVTD